MTMSQQQAMKKLLGGWPRTTPVKDRKKTVIGFRIVADYFTPEGHQRATAFTAVTTFIAGADMAYLAFRVHSVDFAVAAGIGVLLFYLVCQRFWGWVFQKTTTITMTRDLIKVSRAFGYDRYDLMMPPQFTMEQHDDAWLEARDMEMNRKKRSRLYLDSFYVVMTLPGQKAEIATVYKKRKAEALVLRLQLIQQLFDAAGDPATMPAGGSRGQRPDPA